MVDPVDPVEPVDPSEFDWREFAKLAEFLAERGDEASLRSSVSRAYYAVFHLAQAALTRHDPDFDQHRGSDSHKLVWDRLAALGRRQATTAARSGRSLLDKRKLADYRRSESNWPKQTETALAELHRALTALTDLLG
jgi:uncharacterized protein (UPF0332 family)